MKEIENITEQPSEQNNRFGLGLVLALMVVAVLAVFMSSGGSLLDRGTPAPPFELSAVNRPQPLSLESLRGKVVLIDFWSTSCPPCLRQMRDLEVIYRQMDEEDVVVLGINSEGASLQALREFARSRGVGYPMLADPGMVSERYRVQRLPTLYLVDREGKVRWTKVGYVSHREIAQVIQEYI